MGKKRKGHQGLFYRALRMYMLYVHDRFLYKKIYRIHTENVPANGTPVLLVSNHQNCLCDPLTLVFTMRDRKINEFVRADVFKINPLITKILYYLGLNPAYRLDFDGKELLWKNKNMFKRLEEKLLAGETVLMYPEGRHQNKHWLGDFTLGYTKLAFETAALGNFEKDILILPCCNHYSAYKDIQQDVVIKFGTPLSLKPYYELYQTKPRTVQREVNEIVRNRVRDMMLHITDLDNYKAIDFLRNTYGRKFAETNGFRKDYLPDKLESDKRFVKKLQEAKAVDAASVQQIFEDTITIADEMRKLKVRDDHFDKTPNGISIFISILALLSLFPLFLFSLWPNIIIYKLPSFFMRRVKDIMFYNSFLLVISGLATMPILYILSFSIVWIVVNFYVAFIYSLLLPWLGLFAYYYWRFAVRTVQNIRFRRIADTATGRSVRDLRNKLNEQLRNLLLDKDIL